ncbi:hypothetical protein ASG87_01505 [Frateuria sp. Soil773]|uniref:hypothetical protein n=1 Tax=Frateuria sp. Soil773 TaxID=1736407 RepID=UPI0006F8278E|nr:hypothetical protein [Frateuria sp. Soil773]KRE90840.1 hypothetical protein ASG87_01505 [Frateuria sp. Soil773]
MSALQSQSTVWLFVPIDPRTCEPLENESAFLELFAGTLAGIMLGTMGLEHLAHAVDLAENLGDLQTALRPQVTAQATARAIYAYQRNPKPFAPGEIPGVWVPAQVPTAKLMMELQRLGVRPATGGVVRPVATKGEVPWRVIQRSRPVPRLRPRW